MYDQKTAKLSQSGNHSCARARSNSSASNPSTNTLGQKNIPDLIKFQPLVRWEEKCWKVPHGPNVDA